MQLKDLAAWVNERHGATGYAAVATRGSHDPDNPARISTELTIHRHGALVFCADNGCERNHKIERAVEVLFARLDDNGDPLPPPPEHIQALDGLLTQARKHVREAEAAEQQAEFQLQAAVAEHYKVPHLVIGHHECLGSVIGRCVYDAENDHNHDFCIVCHDPSERK